METLVSAAETGKPEGLERRVKEAETLALFEVEREFSQEVVARIAADEQK